MHKEYNLFKKSLIKSFSFLTYYSPPNFKKRLVICYQLRNQLRYVRDFLQVTVSYLETIQKKITKFLEIGSWFFLSSI